MTALDILKSVARRNRVAVALLLSRSRWFELVSARAEAIAMMVEEGMTDAEIARVMRKDRTTIVYWRSAEMRARRSAYYAAVNAGKRAGHAKPHICWKTTPEQRIQLLDLYLAGRRDEVRELQVELGLGADYAQRLARRRNVKRTKPAVPPRPVEGFPEPIAFEPSPASAQVLALLDEALRRAIAPRSLTALAFGDPPTGYSALDRRNILEARA